MANVASITLVGMGDIAFSRYHAEPKLKKETADAYEARTWVHKVHLNSEGFVVVPGMALKKCVEESARYLGIQIPGRGKSTYTKHFRSGFRPENCPVLLVSGSPVSAEEVINHRQDLLVSSNGSTTGTGTRVTRIFPVFANWSIRAEFLLMDNTITKEVFLEHLESAGFLQGIGSFRVGNGGLKGAFKIDYESLTWEEMK